MPTPAPNHGGCNAGDLWFLRFYSGLRRPHYDQLMTELNTIIEKIAVLDAEAIDRANERRALVEQAKELRDVVWPIVPHHHGRHPPAPDERPLPPLRHDAEHLTRRRLRSVCLALLGRYGELPLFELHSHLHLHDRQADGDPQEQQAEVSGFHTTRLSRVPSSGRITCAEGAAAGRMADVPDVAASLDAPVEGVSGAMVRRGAQMVRRHVSLKRKTFTIAVCGAAIFALGTVAQSFVFGWIVDHVITPRFTDGHVGVDAVIGGVIALIVVGAVRAGGVVLRRVNAGRTQMGVAAILRQRVVDRYQDEPLAYFQTNPTGELLAHVQSDAEASSQVLGPLPYACVGRVGEHLVDQVGEPRSRERVRVDRDQSPALGSELALLPTEPLVDDLRRTVVIGPAAARGDAPAQLGNDLEEHREQHLGGWLPRLAPERHDRRVHAAAELAERERLDRQPRFGEHAGDDLGLPLDREL